MITVMEKIRSLLIISASSAILSDIRILWISLCRETDLSRSKFNYIAVFDDSVVTAS